MQTLVLPNNPVVVQVLNFSLRKYDFEAAFCSFFPLQGTIS